MGDVKKAKKLLQEGMDKIQVGRPEEAIKKLLHIDK